MSKLQHNGRDFYFWAQPICAILIVIAVLTNMIDTIIHGLLSLMEKEEK